MAAQPETQPEAQPGREPGAEPGDRSGTSPASPPGAGATATPGGAGDDVLLAALLDGMDAALCAFDADGVVTHWNREAERILGWSARDAVGRRGLGGWAVRSADADEVAATLLGAMRSPGRRVHEFALVTKDGGRVLVRTQSAGVRDADGRPAGVYCAFSEVHTQIDLERSIALSEALLGDASWGMLIIDADLRPAVANTRAVRTVRMGRAALLGRPLGDVLDQGVEEVESALQHVLAEGPPPAPADLWVTLRAGGDNGNDTLSPAGPGAGPSRRRCLRSGFVRLASPLAEEPVPLGVAWIFQDVTEAKLAEQRATRTRFRDGQLNRAARAAAECEDPMEGAALYLEFTLAGFADHALLDLCAGDRLVRAAHSPAPPPGHGSPSPLSGIPLPYGESHPAAQAVDRGGSLRTSVGGTPIPGWAEARGWPADTAHGLCSVLRSRGRALGVLTYLRGASRPPFDQADTRYAEDVAARVAAAVDLARATGDR
ncbi:PAS domain-containing protein [Streptomyces alkaliterrae]|uniref:PAS domain-containing protein n=1 Tax=Streptomyces alkaliterrae TaxID=2213162 RepID=A0A5P0YUZ8_9ACTN|nr:PAS domain-containing protein [Streptomyces alkaliterrae]MBB1253224.1 PAS domain-containing protein [Streptomyces alkaliterrae]MBB1261679.1 PAS domain-containing protein [Streptomyces alkaliterrae]MQS04121.1 PAS domain-containing protein [Streptomyces alkaliterrae]